MILAQRSAQVTVVFNLLARVESIRAPAMTLPLLHLLERSSVNVFSASSTPATTKIHAAPPAIQAMCAWEEKFVEHTRVNARPMASKLALVELAAWLVLIHVRETPALTNILGTNVFRFLVVVVMATCANVGPPGGWCLTWLKRVNAATTPVWRARATRATLSLTQTICVSRSTLP